jgi:sugar phosphate isomerase/epimerase
VADRVLLSASDRNIEACVRLAQLHQIGIEVMQFAYPWVLDGDWQADLSRYRTLLQAVPGARSLHGPFMDMAPGSPDARINQVCMERYQHAIHIAAELEIPLVIFHANFIGAIHTQEYRRGWHARNLDFWGPLADYAQQQGVTVAIENMWEFDPAIIGDLLQQLQHPHLRACLDVGHAHLYSDVPFSTWLSTLQEWIVHLHLNNNDGKLDGHGALDQGVLHYPKLLPPLRALPQHPSMTLEMDTLESMRASLPFLELVDPQRYPG